MAAKDGPTLVLASRSPRRREIMDALGVNYEIVPADIDEASLLDQATGPEDAARRLALSKAEAVAKVRPEAHVLAADTVVCLSSRIFGKPVDEQEATEMLKALRGKPHRVVTGLALLPPETRRPHRRPHQHLSPHASLHRRGNRRLRRHRLPHGQSRRIRHPGH